MDGTEKESISFLFLFLNNSLFADVALLSFILFAHEIALRFCARRMLVKNGYSFLTE